MKREEALEALAKLADELQRQVLPRHVGANELGLALQPIVAALEEKPLAVVEGWVDGYKLKRLKGGNLLDNSLTIVLPSPLEGFGRDEIPVTITERHD